MTSPYSQNASQLIKLAKIFNKFSLPNLSRLSDHTVTLAYQLKEYELVNLNFALSIPNNIITLIHEVTTLYEQPSVQETQATFLMPFGIFSFAWTHNWTLFNSALQTFSQDTAILYTDSFFLQWTVSQQLEISSMPNLDLPNPFMARQRLQHFIITSLEIDLNILGHSITLQASQATESESSFSTIKNILWNSSQSMTNNDWNVGSQDNNDNTPFSADMDPAV